MTELIISLETENLQKTSKLVDCIGKSGIYYKVGLPLFVKEGPAIITFLHAKEKKVFLDLKFFDIPTVVERVLMAAGELGVFMVNFHALAGEETLKKIALVKKKFNKTKFIGVTLLTSFSEGELREEKFLSKDETLLDRVLFLSQKVHDAGLDGVVASVQETQAIKKRCGKDFTVVTPGIRLKLATDDQKRVATVKDAVKQGSDFIVVGRPITEAPDPQKSTQEFLKELRK